MTPCVYCKKPADGSKHDTYGEYRLGRTLVVCDECDDEFAHENGPWNGW
jgi:hypothetical protein